MRHRSALVRHPSCAVARTVRRSGDIEVNVDEVDEVPRQRQLHARRRHLPWRGRGLVTPCSLRKRLVHKCISSVCGARCGRCQKALRGGAGAGGAHISITKGYALHDRGCLILVQLALSRNIANLVDVHLGVAAAAADVRTMVLRTWRVSGKCGVVPHKPRPTQSKCDDKHGCF